MMDEGILNDLLECSVCLERLDTSSRVLPCQHTFCLKCLKEIIQSHKELRCPECRVLVKCRIEELPPNVLLMRILEGMKNSTPRRNTSSSQSSAATLRAARISQMQQQQTQETRAQQQVPANINQQHHQAVSANSIQQQTATKEQLQQQKQPYAVATHNHPCNFPGDLSFKRGDVILLHKNIDNTWYQGECNGKTGLFQLRYVQVMVELPPPICKALYDFKMTAPDEDGCLTFDKGAIITVIRRVDENWAEGRLEDRVGIFPIAFVEMTSSAMNAIGGGRPVTAEQPIRTHPQQPIRHQQQSTTQPAVQSTYQSTAQSHPVYQNHTIQPKQQTKQISELINKAQSINQQRVNHQNDPFPAVVANFNSTISSDSSCSVTPPSIGLSSPNTSSNTDSESAEPNSPERAQNTSRDSALETSLNSSLNSSDTAKNTTASDENPTTSKPTTLVMNVGALMPRPAEMKAENKRHSMNVQSQLKVQHPLQNRHSAEILAVSFLDKQCPGASPARSDKDKRRRRSRSNDRQLPAPYIAIYPYKPTKSDELELKKGNIYMVWERCLDGWFKGSSTRGKSGVFPGNYVVATTSITKPTGPQSLPITATNITTDNNAGSKVPELPPRANSPCAGESQSQFYVWASTQQKPTDKAKEKSTKADKSSVSSGVSLMKRLAAMKKCKSPPPTAAFSIDNPVFEDTPGTSRSAAASAVHVRSGSCPSQLLQGEVSCGVPTLSGVSGGSYRVRHKERPTLVNLTSGNATVAASKHHTRGSLDPSWCNQPASAVHHRKSQSLDANTTPLQQQQQLQRTQRTTYTVNCKERCRCIVPYPPNSEYELELKLDDIVMVHKKRSDGWYKGTLERTGRTGLFPASFVEPCPEQNTTAA